MAGTAVTLSDRLASHPRRSFPDRQARAAHLEALGIAALELTPDPVRIATHGARLALAGPPDRCGNGPDPGAAGREGGCPPG